MRATGTMDALAAAGRGRRASTPTTAVVLAEAYRFCERTRNRWFLVRVRRATRLPTRPEQLAPLARSLGASPAELREQYRRVTRRARNVVERVFYGKT